MEQIIRLNRKGRSRIIHINHDTMEGGQGMMKDKDNRFPNYLLQTNDIISYLQKRIGGKFIDVVARDHLPAMLNKMVKVPESYGGINLDKASGGGTHWTAIGFKNGNLYYFDSFGQPPPLEIERFAKSHRLPLKFNKSILQDPDDVSCGFWVIKWILSMARGDAGDLNYKEI